ncbi:MAG: cytochrome c3 family protein [Bacteroidota bacterium]
MKRRLFFAVLLSAVSGILPGQSVVNSVHNLSVSGPGSIKASSEDQICIFCHTPHNSLPESPLWNKSDPGVVYDLYSSSTVQAVPGQPTGASALCLSCHDGTIALGNLLSRSTDIDFTGGITHLPPGNTNLTSDLSDDHPVSFLYNASLASSDGQLKDPALLTFPVLLENGELQCTSCHDPHKNVYTDFLVDSPQFSGLCLNCHDRSFWTGSSHASSTASWSGSGTDPWPKTAFTSVAENACENCHTPHNAMGRPVLMYYLAEESNCLVCHNGQVAATDIASELARPYLHNVYAYTGLHDAAEDVLVTGMHSECTDCHNPHAVNNASAGAPAASGRLARMTGIDLAGGMADPLLYQYELCFRCHADSPDKPAGLISRQIEQYNTRLEFNPANPSFHPVAATGQNPDCPSLITPAYTESSMIYCTDCHAGSGPGGTRGPHGSDWPGLLRLRNETTDYTAESPENYALCYSCHSRNSILGDESFPYHSRHIVEENTPCSACHDPHGISNTQGSAENNSHLINFDISIVSASGFNLRFVDRGYRSGYCLLRCHGQGHGFGMSY